MRMIVMLPLSLLAVACNVEKDAANDTTTVSFDANAAENGVAAAGSIAENVAGDIGNDVARTGDKIENKVGDIDVDVNTGNDADTSDSNAATNKQ
jgi:hypothetical protein